MTSGPRPGFRPRFLVEAALVGLLLSPLMAVGPWPTTELEVTRYLLILILYGWLGRRLARRGGVPGDAARAGALAGAVAALVASLVQLGAAAAALARLTRDDGAVTTIHVLGDLLVLPEAALPLALGAYALVSVIAGAAFGAAACAVGSLVFRSEDSDANLRALLAFLIRLRWSLGDPVDTAGDLAAADALEGYDAEKARVRRRTTGEVVRWTLLAIFGGIAFAAFVYVLAASSY